MTQQFGGKRCDLLETAECPGTEGYWPKMGHIHSQRELSHFDQTREYCKYSMLLQTMEHICKVNPEWVTGSGQNMN